MAENERGAEEAPWPPDKAADPQARLRAVLEEFVRGTPGVRGAALADRHGLPVASSFRTRIDLATASAMSTLAVSASEDVFRNFGYSRFRCVIMEGDDAIIISCKIEGAPVSLIAVLEPGANMGFVRLSIQRQEEKILGILRDFL